MVLPRTLLLLLLLLAALPAAALTRFDAGFTASEWQAGGDRYACRLSHPIPEFGTATFIREAGRDLRLDLGTPRRLAASGPMQVRARLAVWSGMGNPVDLGEAGWDGHDVAVDAPLATRLLLELRHGRVPEFRAGDSVGSQLSVALSPAAFQAAYRAWLDCLPELLPWNFDQVARTAVHFDSGQHSLDADDQALLDRVVAYTAADPEVLAVYVDGHTDQVGGDRANVQLAKDRAGAVHAYLLAAGMPEAKLRLRFHGERYPVADNSSADGRARNRRATVRLAKEPPPPLPAPDAQPVAQSASVGEPQVAGAADPG